MRSCPTRRSVKSMTNSATPAWIPATAVWAAWGTIIEKRPYLPGCVREMVDIGRRYGARWLCAGKRSAKGHPHHPLYLRKDEKTVDFDVESYLETI